MTDDGLRASMRRLPDGSRGETVVAESCVSRRIADASFDWEVLEDADGRVLWVSPACERITGHPPGEFLKVPGLLLAIVHPEDRSHFDTHRGEALKDNARGEAEFRIVRPDGEVRWIGHRCQPMSLPGGASMGRRSSNREITVVKKADQELLRLNRTLRAVSDSNQALLHARDEVSLLQETCRIIVDDCGHAMVWIGYAEDDPGRTVRPIAYSGFEDGYLETLGLTWADTERGRGPTGTAIRTGRPATCPNMLTDRAFAPWREEALKRGYASSIAFPLLQSGKAFGAITIYSREADPFSEEEVRLLSELAGDLSFGIDSLRQRTARVEAEEALRRHEALLQTVIETSADAIYVKDARSRVVLLNQAALKVVGKPADRILGRDDREFYDDPAVAEAVLENDRRVMKSGVPEAFEERLLTPDGYRHFLDTKAPWRDADGRVAGIIGVSRDITKLKEAEQELLRLNRTLRVLRNCSRAMAHADDEPGFLAEVCRGIVEDCGHVVAWIGLAEEDEEKTVRPVAYSGFSPRFFERLRISWGDNERGRGPTGTAIRTGKPTLCRDIKNDPRFAPWRDESLEEGLASCAIFPLMSGGRAFGSLAIGSRETDRFSDEEMGLLTELAADLALGITSIRSRADHVRAEEALRRSEERYRNLFESMNEGFALGEVLWDDEGKPSDWRYHEVNSAFSQLTGLPREMVEGRRVREVISGIESFWIEAVARVVESGLPERIQGHVARLNRDYEAFAWRTGPGRFALIFTDITERKRAGEALEAERRKATDERNRLEAVMEALPVGIAIIDEHGGNVRSNRAFEEVWGGPRPLTASVDDYAAYKAWWVETGEPVRPEEWASAIALREGKAVVGQRVQIQTFDGRRAFVLNSASPVLDSDGRITGCAVAIVDVTAARETEERLRELNETLEVRVGERTAEAERKTGQLRALASELSQTEWRERQRLAGVLHDHLQQILVGAKFSLEALEGRIPDGELKSLTARAEELLDQSIAECRTLTLALSPPVLQEGGLSGGLAWLSRRMQEQHGLRVDLEVRDEFLEPADGGIKFFLFAAVGELLFNVAKHSGVREARVSLGRKNGQIEIRVEDRGRGFDSESRKDPGRDLEGGFGLFSIRHRTDLIGGVATVRSAPGEGTSVTLLVPTDPIEGRGAPGAFPLRGEPSPVAADPPAAPVRSGRIRIVIADDHKMLREGLMSLLKVDEMLEVVGEAADGVEAVELARTLRPDVVIMDVAMPRMNGIEATRQIAAELPGIRVIGLSMHEDEMIGAAMLEAGAVAFLTKGGPSEALISTIRAALSGGDPS